MKHRFYKSEEKYITLEEHLVINRELHNPENYINMFKENEESDQLVYIDLSEKLSARRNTLREQCAENFIFQRDFEDKLDSREISMISEKRILIVDNALLFIKNLIKNNSVNICPHSVRQVLKRIDQIYSETYYKKEVKTILKLQNYLRYFIIIDDEIVYPS